ncbi:hypothetical protein V1504DRAFT_316654 [Lipomyces starkeyi]
MVVCDLVWTDLKKYLALRLYFLFIDFPLYNLTVRLYLCEYRGIFLSYAFFISILRFFNLILSISVVCRGGGAARSISVIVAANRSLALNYVIYVGWKNNGWNLTPMASKWGHI